MSAFGKVNRRQFLRNLSYGGAGLMLGTSVAGCSTLRNSGAGPAGEFEPNAFVRVTPDDRVIVISKHVEMGQGAYTGLATLVAEELDADWSRVAVEGAPADTARYGNLAWGGVRQGTGGSTAMRNAYQQMREAGATARAMLVAAAAQLWQVPASEVTVTAGVVSHHASNRSARFGELAELAATQPLPGKVKLKQPQQFTLIGQSLPRKDSGKTTGQAQFTQDIQLPDMLTAVIAVSPKAGGVVHSFDASATRQVEGVVEVLQVPAGVAVLARDYWSAQQGRKALKIEWDNSGAFTGSSASLLQSYHAELEKPGVVAAKAGDAEAGLSAAGAVIDAHYEFPYLAHAAMEPLNCVMQKRGDGVEAWYGCQWQSGDQETVARVFGIDKQQVKINMLLAGGSFGRRANPVSDYVEQTAQIVKAYEPAVPIKLVWSREDDMRGWYYRPMYVHRLTATLGADGYPLAWRHHIVGQSIAAVASFIDTPNGVDRTTVEGANNLPYGIPNLAVYQHTTPPVIPIQWWRSVGSTHTAYSTETFLDELAQAAGADPVEYRRHLLQESPRHLAVLNLAAEKAGWGSALPAGVFRGVAVHESFHSVVAQVAEIEDAGNGKYRLRKVVCAVDCGVAINPDIIRAQMEGGIGFGLSPALMSEITLRDGEVEQSNFHDYQVLRINQMPEVEVHIVPSAEPPTGVGEPATPVIAPALANALFAATGKMPRKLPFKGLVV
ncbi:xanthine dehydrogenase family protein molybdopterin-binding subunit [Pseudomaricurvus sp. HS19]|uniref:xanthine dehydrogenase family protein molybdopterin-binding subunit n=1 Tax=Pseudomaricurvus sp. HS19 TaxID=2692626 RepID=UPI001F236778|nr:xanthine dehydrogenase family protein molybdopterin-binding subunit [Pseudomaricurvus sp. HS19]